MVYGRLQPIQHPAGRISRRWRSRQHYASRSQQRRLRRNHLEIVPRSLQPCAPAGSGACVAYGTFCDPQLGCSDRLVAQDLNSEHAWQLNQEFRLASNFSGPFNFSVGGNYMHYETEENYYVFINTLTLASYTWARQGASPDQTLPWVPGVSDNSNCINGGLVVFNPQQSRQFPTGDRRRNGVSVYRSQPAHQPQQSRP